MRRFQIAVTRNPLSLLGALLATFSAAIVLTLFVLEMVGFDGGPYIGILAYLVFPALLLLGLILIPLGVRSERRRARRQRAEGKVQPDFPVIDLNQDKVRRTFLVVAALSIVNVIVFTAATYKGVEVMESNEFCGTACHTVMEPEHTAHMRSPHAQVDCVDCHIGSGVGWFAKSKLSGAWQVVSVTFNLYSRPIGTPVHDLRPARETCGECHWPSSFVGNRLNVRTHYASDEENTELKTVLLMRVGGEKGNGYEGIHWHVDPGVEIRYRSDPSRESIYDVEMKLADGTSKTFLSPAQAEEGWEAAAGELEWRTMDCVDCHNRATHVYRLPEEEIDAAMEAGRISTALPFIRREGLAALAGPYASHDEAREGIATRIGDFYRGEYPELYATRREEIDRAAAELGDLYSYNVFPRMNVDWGAYPDHRGHEQSPGCFRCHNDEHETADGEVLFQDCFTCHNLLALEEESPEILADLEF